MTQEEINKAFEGRWRIKGNMGQINSATMTFDEFYDYIKDLCRNFFEAGILIAEKEHAVVPEASPSGINLPDTTSTHLEEASFNQWWEIYDKKCGRKDCLTKWKRLSHEEKKACILATPAYVEATPDKQYRKNPLTYLNQKAWNDEIINRNGNTTDNNLNKLAAILAP